MSATQRWAGVAVFAAVLSLAACRAPREPAAQLDPVAGLAAVPELGPLGSLEEPDTEAAQRLLARAAELKEESRLRREWLAQRESERAQRRVELEQRVALQPGWSLYESEHYIILSEVHDLNLLDELMARAEAVRASLVRRFRPNIPLGGANAPSLTAIRVFEDSTGYHEYGGPAGSTSFYSSPNREAVIHMDERGAGSSAGFSALQHILVHEYFDAELELEQTSFWLLYGVAELYGGMELRRGALVLEDPDSRLKHASLDEEQRLPLAELLSYDRNEFLGNNRRGRSAYLNVLESWSLAYFLRVGSEQAPDWDPAWGDLFERCSEAASAREDALGQLSAVQASYSRLDLAALERAWAAWVDERRGR